MNLILTSDDVFMGTPGFVAPEVLTNIGWTAKEFELLSIKENKKICKQCGWLNGMHLVDGELETYCPE